MKYSFPSFRIQLFAREPVAGRVKTRLYPAIGEARALALHRNMLNHVAASVKRSKLAEMELWVSSNPSHEVFLTICNKKDIYLQSGSDLGIRMANAVRQGLGFADAVILIGADCPSIDENYLKSACQALDEGADVVLGPARDGGYVLLGLRKFVPEIFNEMPWGSSEVLSLTLEKLEQQGCSCKLLESRWDVDTAEDLILLETLKIKIPY